MYNVRLRDWSTTSNRSVEYHDTHYEVESHPSKILYLGIRK